MKIIKLNATNSTNSFLKEMILNQTVADFTVIVADFQTKGRGQMQSKWISEAGKNLMFSVFCTLKDLSVINQRYFNFTVSLSIIEALEDYNLPRLAIKWPNDILSEKKKICGILIENFLRGNHIKSSIVGVGLNVNQESFPADLPNASSIRNILKKEINLDDLLTHILEKLKMNIEILNEKKYDVLEERYLNTLYKKDVPSMFKDAQGNLFMGKIIGVSTEGKLQMELEDDVIKVFGIKEIVFL